MSYNQSFLETPGYKERRGKEREGGEIESGYNCVMERYRCVHYADGGKCNRDLCGDCFKPKEASTSPQVFSNQALPVSLLHKEAIMRSAVHHKILYFSNLSH